MSPHSRPALPAAIGGLVLAVALAAPASAYLASPATIWTIAGNETTCAVPTGTCGDGPDATRAQVSSPSGIDIDAAGNLFIADTGANKIRKITPAGTISTVAGTGTGCASGLMACGDGGLATSAQLNSPIGVAVDVDVDGSGILYIADRADNKIRKVSSGTISTLAGSGATCSPSTAACGDFGPPASATFDTPTGVGVSADGADVYVADQGSKRVRRITGKSIRTSREPGCRARPRSAATAARARRRSSTPPATSSSTPPGTCSSPTRPRSAGSPVPRAGRRGTPARRDRRAARARRGTRARRGRPERRARRGPRARPGHRASPGRRARPVRRDPRARPARVDRPDGPAVTRRSAARSARRRRAR